MKELHGAASETSAADIEACRELLSDVAGYPGWYGEVVRSVEVLESSADGRASRARTVLRVSIGPLNRDVEMILTVSSAPDRVTLTRVPHDSSDHERFAVRWQLEEAGGGSTQINLDIDAALDVPRLVPVGGIGDTIAAGFVSAAVRELGAPAR